jgi:hypothetical protein
MRPARASRVVQAIALLSVVFFGIPLMAGAILAMVTRLLKRR